jgi:probable HAF family extracellular repeat protein
MTITGREFFNVRRRSKMKKIIIIMIMVFVGQVMAEVRYTVSDLKVSTHHAAINDNGQLTLPFWTLVGGNQSYAHDKNNRGQVVGGRYVKDVRGCKAFLYKDGMMKNLGTLGGSNSNAESINENGQIVGDSTIGESNFIFHAFLYEDGKMKDLGTLGGTNSFAYGINNNGQVVGISYTDESYMLHAHAFLYEDGTMKDLGTLGGVHSRAYAINDKGYVVGSSDTIGDEDTKGTPDAVRAFLYDGTKMKDLNDLLPKGSGWVLHYAYDINSSGQIVGRGTINGKTSLYLMTPNHSPIINAI